MRDTQTSRHLARTSGFWGPWLPAGRRWLRLRRSAISFVAGVVLFDVAVRLDLFIGSLIVISLLPNDHISLSHLYVETTTRLVWEIP